MKLIPTNVTFDGCAYTIRARYDGVRLDTLTGGGGYFPQTGVIVLIEE